MNSLILHLSAEINDKLFRKTEKKSKKSHNDHRRRRHRFVIIVKALHGFDVNFSNKTHTV